MSEYLAPRYANMTPYVPGEQPRDRAYIKLNANEATVPPCPGVARALADTAMLDNLCRYADPRCMPLRQAVADRYGMTPDEVFVGNGSDEVLALIFMTFMQPGDRLAFPDVTYGLYHDYASTFGLTYEQMPLREDWTLDVDAFADTTAHVVFPNPNAPTGLRIAHQDVARIASAHPDRLMIIDEAYVDFGTKTCAQMVRDHRNLIVVQTMSKSRNLAGAHIGYAFAQPDLVADMRDIKFSFNPFNVSAPTMAIGIAALQDEEFFRAYTQAVCDERDATQEALRAMGFTVTTSHTNFVFATHPQLTAEDWQARLREEGILTRRFAGPRTGNWLRVSVGTHDEMQAFLQQTKRILDSLAS